MILYKKFSFNNNINNKGKNLHIMKKYNINKIKEKDNEFQNKKM